MTPICLIFSLAVIISAVHAAPVEPNQPPSNWSKEAIFSLLGFFAAVLTILAMVLMASPSAQKWCTGTRSDTELASMEGAVWEEYMEAKKKTLMLRKKWEESIRPRHA
ncbi:hypothetical protein HBH70_068410 [Parastagonospora nodorum]|nr:hypothetical protein HBH51_121790 [Parastagonospora nodorum]KAH3988688.1 hypothetical protein HBH52_030290 [Parastagonospora nodorum]KAH4053783.1 hypothetical protein HBH49_088450 [Parastagonospora nodorum]KAH4067091.1 hypothetical protein HBH50_135400 [Parastagonospora nodorum]KAH4085254.1 hypothetical protein HBH48_158560 [Parastagonospora nodorum]